MRIGLYLCPAGGKELCEGGEEGEEGEGGRKGQ